MKSAFCLSLISWIFLSCMKMPDDVLTYWFGADQREDRTKLWFAGEPFVDQEIRERFALLLQEGVDHKLETWKQTPKGRLALIVLIDQFSRNIYRGKAQAFEADLIAQKLCLEGIALGEDVKLSPIERVFFYLPLEHAEDLALQALSIEQFQKLAEHGSVFESFLKYALLHQLIIERFGHFPHRNALLGRVSTSEERQFLKQPHSSF